MKADAETVQQQTMERGDNIDSKNDKETEEKCGEISNEKSVAIDMEFANEEKTNSVDSKENVVTTEPLSAGSLTYEDAYRAGNFGITLGKVDQTRGFKWALVHMGLTSLMMLLTIVGTGLVVEYYKGKLLGNLAIGFTWINSLFGIASALLAWHFFRNLKKMHRPYAFLMGVRFMAIFNWTLLLLSVIFVSLIAASDRVKAFTGSDAIVTLIKAAYTIIIIIMIVEMVVSFSFLCSPKWSELCNVCSCCGPCCIYSEGEEVAPGEPNPPSQETWQLVAYFLEGFQSRLEERI